MLPSRRGPGVRLLPDASAGPPRARRCASAYFTFPLGETSLKTFPVVPDGPTLSVVST
jgi:hypothetical protein